MNEQAEKLAREVANLRVNLGIWIVAALLLLSIVLGLPSMGRSQGCPGGDCGDPDPSDGGGGGGGMRLCWYLDECRPPQEDLCWYSMICPPPEPDHDPSHGCGLGWELVLLVPLLARRRR